MFGFHKLVVPVCLAHGQRKTKQISLLLALVASCCAVRSTVTFVPECDGETFYYGSFEVIPSTNIINGWTAVLTFNFSTNIVLWLEGNVITTGYNTVHKIVNSWPSSNVTAGSTLTVEFAATTTSPYPTTAEVILQADASEKLQLTYFNQTASWNTAEKVCNENGGHLVKVDNREISSVMEYFMKKEWSTKPLKKSNYWIGLSIKGTASNDNYTWFDGSPLGHFQNWDGRNLPGGTTTCSYCTLGKRGNGQWRAIRCHNMRQFICQKRIALDVEQKKCFINNTTCILSSDTSPACTAIPLERPGAMAEYAVHLDELEIAPTCYEALVNYETIPEFLIYNETKPDCVQSEISELTSSFYPLTASTALELQTSALLGDESFSLVVTPTVSCCPCPNKKALTKEESEAVVSSILEDMEIVTKNLSSFKRKYVSAPDSRKSSQGIGYSGGIILGIVFGGLIILDLPKLNEDIRQFFRCLRGQCGNHSKIVKVRR